MDFLHSVTPDNQDEFLLQMRRFNLGPVGEADCPVFDGMFEYCAVGCGRHMPDCLTICASLSTTAFARDLSCAMRFTVPPSENAAGAHTETSEALL